MEGINVIEPCPHILHFLGFYMGMGCVIRCLTMALLPRGCRLGPKQSLYKICSLVCMEGWDYYFFSPLSKKKKSMGKYSKGFAAAQNITAICRGGALSAAAPILRRSPRPPWEPSPRRRGRPAAPEGG